jgi:hypothetical protein
MKIIILLLLCASFAFCGQLRYWTFATFDQAIIFVNKQAGDFNEALGGWAWVSSHRIIPIPVSIDSNGMISNKFVVVFPIETRERFE